MYIEDNALNVAFMRDLIDELPSTELVTVPTAEIGIELVRARQPDVVILDINLPGMNGFDAAAQLHAWPETREIPIIGLSVLSRESPRAQEAGFYRYLPKPVRVPELTQVLEELLSRS